MGIIQKNVQTKFSFSISLKHTKCHFQVQTMVPPQMLKRCLMKWTNKLLCLSSVLSFLSILNTFLIIKIMKGQNNLLIQDIFATMMDFDELTTLIVLVIISHIKSICGPFCILKFHYHQKEKGRISLSLHAKSNQY